MSLRRPLITGAGGFIGSHLARNLSRNSDVEFIYLVDLKDSPRLSEFKNSQKFRIIEADLSDSDLDEILPDDATAVFALAAFNGTGRFYSLPFSVLKNSTLPTLNIIEYYAGVIPIIYSSSSEVYASTVELFNWDVPTSEQVPLVIESIHNPRWSYATAKLFGEIALASAAKQLGATGAIIRYHNVYGPDMGRDHIVPDFIERAKGGVFEITGANQTRAFMHVLDAVEGTVAALSKASSKIPIYHLGSREEITIVTAAKIILDEMGMHGKEISQLPPPEGSVYRRCANPTRAEQELNWMSKINFREGIRSYLS